MRATGADESPGAPKLAVETAAVFFKVLQAGAGGLPPELQTELRAAMSEAVAANPTLAGAVAAVGAGRGANPANPGGEAGGGGGFPADVEAEANSYFQRLYSGQHTVEQTVDMLTRFRGSQIARSGTYSGAWSTTSLTSTDSFPSTPRRSCESPRCCSVGLINHQLVVSMTLGVALRCVLDALRKPIGNKMFAFGSEALEQFKQRLPEWPQFCQHLAQVPQVPQAHPDLAQLLGAAAEQRGLSQLGQNEPSMAGSSGDLAGGLAGLNLGGENSGGVPPPAPRPPVPPGAPPADEQAGSGGGVGRTNSMPAVASKPGGAGLLASQPSAPAGLLGRSASNLGPSAPSVAGSGSGFATSLNLETLERAGSNQNISVPDAETVDKVHFVVNNLSTQNMDDKAAEVKARISREQWPWFAVYLVVKRASIEPNFHVLYLGLLDALNEPDLIRLVLDATYSNIKALLSSNKIKTNSGERSLLKNLGSWLGQLTHARNQPVLMNDLDLKGLILESYQTGHMIAVIPFIAKVLEPAKDSIIFRPPNPWTTAVLALLKEIYSERDLKLNLKFEMERLFKHLEMDIKTVKPSQLLYQIQRERVGNPDFVADKNAPAAPPTSMPGVMGGAGGVPYEPGMGGAGMTPGGGGAFGGGMGGMGQGDGGQMGADMSGGVTAAMQQHVKIAPAPNLPENVRLALARLLPVALTSAVREIVSPVVERSVTIACMTSRELVLKDFAVEPDAARLRKAAHLMVSSLAGSLLSSPAASPSRRPSPRSFERCCSRLARCPRRIPRRSTRRFSRRWWTTSSSAAPSSSRRPPSAPSATSTRPSPPPSWPGRSIARSTAPRVNRFSTRRTCRADSPAPCPSRSAPGPDTSPRRPSASTRTSRPCRARPRRPRARRPRSRRRGEASPSTARRRRRRPRARIRGSRRRRREPPAEHPRRRPPAVPPTAWTCPAASRRSPRPSALGLTDLPRAVGRSALSNASAFLQRLDAACATDPAARFSLLPETHEARGAVADVAAAAQGDDARVAVAQKIFQKIYERSGKSRLHRTAHVAALAALTDGSRVVQREVTGWLVYADEERKCDKEITEALVRAGVVSGRFLADFDQHLAELIAGGASRLATELGAHLVRHCVLVEPCVEPTELGGVLDALAKAATRATAPEGLAVLVERARAAGDAASSKKPPGTSGGLFDPQKPDPPGLRETVAQTFDDWARVQDLPAGDTTTSVFVENLAKGRLLHGDDAQERTARILAELAMTHCLGSELPPASGGMSTRPARPVRRRGSPTSPSTPSFGSSRRSAADGKIRSTPGWRSSANRSPRWSASRSRTWTSAARRSTRGRTTAR